MLKLILLKALPEIYFAWEIFLRGVSEKNVITF